MPALTKTIAIIRCLNDLSAAGASLQEVAERLQITKSHCHNILKTLTREGWLAYDDKRRSYSLAPRLLTDVSCLIRARRAPHLLIHEELARTLASDRHTLRPFAGGAGWQLRSYRQGGGNRRADRIRSHRPSFSAGCTGADARTFGVDGRRNSEGGS